MIRIIIILCTFYALTACGNVPPVPVDHFYRLTQSQQNVEKNHVPGNVLYVGNFLAEGLYNERALLFVADEEGRELQQLHYHFWITSPPRLLREFLVDYIRHTNNEVIVYAGTGKKGEYMISGKVLEFEYLKLSTGKAASVSLELRLDRVGDDRPVIVNKYRVLEDINGDDIDEIVAAMNRATLTVYNRFFEDLTRSM